jgi:PAS domain S-box-containing protein
VSSQPIPDPASPPDDDLHGAPASAILAHLPVGVWVARAPTGEVLYTNQSFQATLGMGGVPGVDIEGAPAVYGIYDRAGNLYPVENLPFSRALATGRTVTVEDLVIHRADGRRANVRAVASPVRDAAGTIAFVSVAFIEITAEVKAIEERTRVEAWLRFALSHAPVVLFAMDRQGTITLSEGNALAAMGLRSGQLVGQSAFDIYRSDPVIMADLHRTMAGHTVTNTVTVGDVVLETWMSPVRGDRGDVTGLIGISTDVSERRKLQARAIQNDRVAAMGLLAASVAHEINNPLTYVLGSLERADGELEAALARRGDDGRAAMERTRALLAGARSAAERVGAIARDLRTFSRPGDDAEQRPVSVAAVIRAVLQLVEKEIEVRARLTVTLADTPPVKGNEQRLVQVVLNLVVNAWQALPDPDPARHEIGLRTYRDDGFVVIEVSDTGPGIPAGLRARIFEPFFSTKDVGEGSGLGLFVCRNIVAGFGGDIAVDDRPGGGTLFRVRLPIAEAPADEAPLAATAPAAAAEAPAVVAGRPQVLIIDDDERVAQVFTLALRDIDCDASTVAEGRAALARLLGEERFDLIYCDLMMRGMTGMDIHQALRQRAPERLARLVFMTGGAYTPAAAAFVDEHAANVVYKPFDIRAETRRRLGR